MPKATHTLPRGEKPRLLSGYKPPRIASARRRSSPAANDNRPCDASTAKFMALVDQMTPEEQDALAGLLLRMLEGGKPRPAIVAYLVEIGFTYAQASIRADRAMAAGVVLQ